MVSGAGRLCTNANGRDFDATEEQDNYSDMFLYASDVGELEAAFLALKDGPTQKILRLAPGEYQLTETLAIDDKDLSGCWIEAPSGSVTLIGPADAPAVKIHFAASHLAATFEFGFKNLTIEGAEDQDAIQIDNTDAGKKINLYMDNACGQSSGTGKALNTTHGDTSNAIRVYCYGGFNADWGAIALAGGNNGDRFIAHPGCSFEDGLSTSDTAVLYELTFNGCLLMHEGITGGNAAQKVNLVGCYTVSGGAMSGADSSDVAGSQTAAVSPVPGEGV